MSLINDALKDLDSRSDDVSAKVGESLLFENEICEQDIATRGSRVFRAWPYFVMPTAVIVSAFFVFDLQGHDAVIGSESIDSVRVVNGNNDASDHESANENAAVLNGNQVIMDSAAEDREAVVSEAPLLKSETETPASVQALTTREATIAFYLEQADSAIARNRLSVPSKGNALFFLSKVIALDPENIRAGSMYKDIQRSYLGQIASALDNHHFRRAETLLSRSDTFGFSALALEAYQTRLSQAVEHNRVIADRVIENGYPGGVKPLSVDQNAEVDMGSITSADTETTLPNANAVQRKWVTVTSESEDLHYVNQIKERIHSGDEQAIEALATRVKQNVNALHSEMLLFEYYLGRSEFDKAQKLLNSLDIKHIASDYFNAQLTHHFHGPVRAISILESSNVADIQGANQQLRERQTAFLAALYQKTENYKKAQSLYASLLREDQHNIQYTLGFALAADADGDRYSALTAYRKISASGYQNDSVVKFVEKRISVLEANDLAEATRW